MKKREEIAENILDDYVLSHNKYLIVDLLKKNRGVYYEICTMSSEFENYADFYVSYSKFDAESECSYLLISIFDMQEISTISAIVNISTYLK